MKGHHFFCFFVFFVGAADGDLFKGDQKLPHDKYEYYTITYNRCHIFSEAEQNTLLTKNVLSNSEPVTSIYPLAKTHYLNAH